MRLHITNTVIFEGKQYRQDEMVDLPDDKAEHLIRAGAAVAVDDQGEPLSESEPEPEAEKGPTMRVRVIEDCTVDGRNLTAGGAERIAVSPAAWEAVRGGQLVLEPEAGQRGQPFPPGETNNLER